MALPPPVLQQMPREGPLRDRFDRRHDYLRVSVTDRCNFRCVYCMPAEGLDWMPREDILSYEEITRLVAIFVRLGVRRVRLTGGEPTIRRDLPALVRSLAALDGLDELSMTTNALLLDKLAPALAEAGLRRVNISLDSLDSEQFARLTRGASLERVLGGIEAALAAGLTPVKLNCVVVGGENEDQLLPLVRYAELRPGLQLRFIEYMPFDSNGGARRHVPVARLRERLAAHAPFEAVAATGGGPARDVRLASGLVVGFISPITEHFCDACNRLRLQADGSLRTCLSRDRAPNLRDLLRAGVDDAGLETAIRLQLWGKVAGHEAHLDGDFRRFEGVMTRVGG